MSRTEEAVELMKEIEQLNSILNEQVENEGDYEKYNKLLGEKKAKHEDWSREKTVLENIKNKSWSLENGIIIINICDSELTDITSALKILEGVK